ncbi:Protein of unknown function (DUF1569) [Bernardetia litoralis DSM 6794]|uniref:DinB-like domain-containing protein n=2 Tax=Bernardetia litoralis TaxID=999 RepID=I4AH26_BERLS|nr:Protein of unknown function (DUF1569) [Bernardetia litoralis DSM 6794]
MCLKSYSHSKIIYMFFKKQLSELESYIPQLEKTNSKITHSNIGWQIDHSLRVIRGIAWQLEESNPNEFASKFSIQKSFILLTGYIPRGKAKAPKAVQNENEITEESIRDFLEKTKSQVDKIDNLDKNSHFSHPYFGKLNKKEAIRFIEIHTEHHLKIIRDILQ